MGPREFNRDEAASGEGDHSTQIGQGRPGQTRQLGEIGPHDQQVHGVAWHLIGGLRQALAKAGQTGGCPRMNPSAKAEWMLARRSAAVCGDDSAERLGSRVSGLGSLTRVMWISASSAQARALMVRTSGPVASSSSMTRSSH